MTFVAANTPFKESPPVVAEANVEEGPKVVSLPVSDTETLGDVGSVPSIQKYLHSEDSAVKETVPKESSDKASSEGSKDIAELSQNSPEQSNDSPKEQSNSPKEQSNSPKEQSNTSKEQPITDSATKPTSQQPLPAKEPPPISIAASQAASTKPPRLLCVVPLELLQHHQSLVEARETASHLQRELALAQCVLQLLTDSLHVALR